MLLGLFYVFSHFSLPQDPFTKASLDELLGKAKSQEKLVLLDVYTEWCGPCKQMDQTTWQHHGVRDYLNGHFVAAKIDAEKGEGLTIARKYEVTGYPCLLVLNTRGELLARSYGYLPPKSFISWIQSQKF